MDKSVSFLFLDTGEIVEGEIVDIENDAEITVSLKNGSIKKIVREKILRIKNSGNFKEPVYIQLKPEPVMCYIVEEGKNFYIVRKDLK